MSRLTQHKTFNLPVNYNELHYTEKRIVREQYIVEQDNKCFYCKYSLDKDPPIHITKNKINWDLFPLNFLNSPIHLQHCHKTGMTEGAVHMYCNAVLWEYYER